MSAEFRKWEDHINDGNHLILDHPENIGSIGAISRTALAFGIHDIAVIDENILDTFDPSLIRSSMGARLKVHIEVFSCIEEYRSRFQKNQIYAFVLDEGASRLEEARIIQPYTLAFGNESLGLPEAYRGFSQNVFIAQSEEVDSLNVCVAAAISLKVFTNPGPAF
ncbi:MAG: hypothetical protein IJU93_07635 [Lachnospiraceae bacterium]|nr:hypothetical protein [Lachnospiraceae bacterium]